MGIGSSSGIGDGSEELEWSTLIHPLESESGSEMISSDDILDGN